MIHLTHHATLSTTATELFDNISYPQRVHWIPSSYNNVKSGFVCPPHKLAEGVLKKDIIEDVKNRPAKTAFILAAGNSNFAAEGRVLEEKNHLSYQYKMLPLSLTQIYAGRIASMFGKVDYVATDASACASGLKVMMDVQTLINLYRYERVIVLAVEDQVNNMTLQFFGESGASLTEKIAQENGVVPSAFDSHNFGFYLGQGAALAVFETSNIARHSYARLVSAYTASESGANAIGQREDGQGFVDAIEGCLSLSGVYPKEIRVIKTHGTGTKSNNCAEKTAIESVFKDFIATSYKPMIGHTMGASGLLESLMMISQDEIPAILNRTEDDSRYLSKPEVSPGGYMLSLAAGMGNIYSAAIFKRGE